jgi:5-(carboxyamino)imidazole ribonucleotide mutase
MIPFGVPALAGPRLAVTILPVEPPKGGTPNDLSRVLAIEAKDRKSVEFRCVFNSYEAKHPATSIITGAGLVVRRLQICSDKLRSKLVEVAGFLAFARNDRGSWRFTETPYNSRMPESKPLVAIIMGSKSDWDTMRNAVETLNGLGVPNEARVLSAHRTPDATAEFARGAADRGVRVIIAGAGGAAHLAGVIAAHTWLPVLGVPIQSKLQGLDSLLSTAQMPGGIPVGTLAIGEAGAKNAALLAAAILATSDDALRQKLEAFRKKQSEAVLAAKLPT